MSTLACDDERLSLKALAILNTPAAASHTPESDEPYRYKPELLFEDFDRTRPWHILVTEPGAERRVAERAHPVGVDIYFPTAFRFARKSFNEIEGPVWGRYVAAAVQAERRADVTIAHALAVRGVCEILSCDGRPYSIEGQEILGWWRRQERGELDEGKRVRRRLYPRWVKIGHLARIIGGISSFFEKLEGKIVSISSPDDIGVEVEMFGRKTIVSAPLVFLEKAA
jgi:transcription antitermination factor NusG